MNEEEIRVFIDGVVRYFDRVTGKPATVETPFLKGEHPISLDYTGVIGISGRQRGAVFFTSDSALLTKVLETLGEVEIDSEAMADLVGEVANTISGNARRFYGHEFRITVPTVMQGGDQDVGLPGKPKELVIPVLWQGLRCYLIVSLETPPALVA
jgi:chemotaxis protein CheX